MWTCCSKQYMRRQKQYMKNCKNLKDSSSGLSKSHAESSKMHIISKDRIICITLGQKGLLLLLHRIALFKTTAMAYNPASGNVKTGASSLSVVQSA